MRFPEILVIPSAASRFAPQCGIQPSYESRSFELCLVLLETEGSYFFIASV
jgi:hypothetical protein